MSVIVLVGGSFLGAWAWEKVTPTLKAAGHEVYPLTLTGAGDRAHLASTSTTLNLNADRAKLAVAGFVGWIVAQTILSPDFCGHQRKRCARVLQTGRQEILAATSLPQIIHLATSQSVEIPTDLHPLK